MRKGLRIADYCYFFYTILWLVACRCDYLNYKKEGGVCMGYRRYMYERQIPRQYLFERVEEVCVLSGGAESKFRKWRLEKESGGGRFYRMSRSLCTILDFNRVANQLGPDSSGSKYTSKRQLQARLRVQRGRLRTQVT